VAGSRVRPDGGVVRWGTAFPELGPQEPPFLIEHDAAGAEWDADARAARAAFRHPVGGRVRLTGLALPVGDATAVAARYASVLGLGFGEGWRAAVGSQWVALADDGTVSSPVVHMAGEAGTPALDVAQFGVRWLRVPAAARGG
jgi:hypothetical protein